MTDQRSSVGMGARLFAAAFLFAVATARADVALVPCTFGAGYDYGSNPHVICGGAEGHGGGDGVFFNSSPLPFASFLSGVGGSMGVAGGGARGTSAVASGQGTFGEVHLFSSADNGGFQTIDSNHIGQASAQAEIAFVDGGSIGAVAGLPIDLRLTLSMTGGFTGTADATFDFVLSDNNVFLGERTAFLYSGQPTVSLTWDLTVFGGDILFFGMDMRAEGVSTNDGALVFNSTADVSHTGRLFLDVLTPGADFVSNSGTNYSSSASASAPEPGSALLLVCSLLGLALFAFQRSRDRKGAVGRWS